MDLAKRRTSHRNARVAMGLMVLGLAAPARAAETAAALARQRCEELIAAGADADAAACYGDWARDHASDPRVDEVVFNQAVALLQAKRGDEAAAVFDGLATRYPQSKLAPKAVFKAAMAHAELGHDAQAAAAYERYLAQWPKESNVRDALHSAASLRLRLGDCAAARTHARALARLAKEGSEEAQAADDIQQRCLTAIGADEKVLARTSVRSHGVRWKVWLSAHPRDGGANEAGVFVLTLHAAAGSAPEHTFVLFDYLALDRNPFGPLLDRMALMGRELVALRIPAMITGVEGSVNLWWFEIASDGALVGRFVASVPAIHGYPCDVRDRVTVEPAEDGGALRVRRVRVNHHPERLSPSRCGEIRSGELVEDCTRQDGCYAPRDPDADPFRSPDGHCAPGGQVIPWPEE